MENMHYPEIKVPSLELEGARENLLTALIYLDSVEDMAVDREVKLNEETRRTALAAMTKKAREHLINANKVAERMLEQVPGWSSEQASDIVDRLD